MKKFLENLYTKYNKREFIHPDPLEFLYNYTDPNDREIVGLIASALAYGRVAQILKSVSIILSRMGDNPHSFVIDTQDAKLKKEFKDFKHRFTTGEDVAGILISTKAIISEYGSLGCCFADGFDPKSPNILPALSKFVAKLDSRKRLTRGLLPSPEIGSACKRLNLYLRWMVRKDAVDPGGWKGVPASKLIVPLDTHMHKLGKALKFTKRNAADICTAVEITTALAKFCPDDPVKYDFPLTRLGIRGISVSLPSV